MAMPLTPNIKRLALIPEETKRKNDKEMFIDVNLSMLTAAYNNQSIGVKLQGSKLAKGSLEFSSGSLKFREGAQKCTGFYTQRL